MEKCTRCSSHLVIMTVKEHRLTTSEGKELAAVFALKKLHVNLLSDNPFVIYTDHQALKTAFKKKEFHGRRDTWIDLIAEHDLEVSYKLGPPITRQLISRKGVTLAKGIENTGKGASKKDWGPPYAELILYVVESGGDWADELPRVLYGYRKGDREGSYDVPVDVRTHPEDGS